MLLKKLGAFGLMGLIVAGFAIADTSLLYRVFVRRQFVVDELERLVGRRVTLGSISYGPFKGLVAEGIEIPTKAGQPFVRADRVCVQIDRSRLFAGKVSIASVELERPMVRLDLSPNGRGELIEFISEVARHAGESVSTGGPIPNIRVTAGTFEFAPGALTQEGRGISVKDVEAELLPYGAHAFVIQGGADAGALGRWRIEGRIDTATGRSEIRFATKELVLGPGSVAAFGPEVRRVYDMYNVAGAVDADVIAIYDSREAKPFTIAAEVQPRGISVEYANFRYKVLNVRGLIRLKDDGIEFQGMTARFWPKGPDGESATPFGNEAPIDIAMSGATDGYVGASAYTLHFNIENLPISAKLRGALQAEARNVYDLFDPSGLLRGKVDVVKPHGAGLPIAHNIEMAMVDCKATFQPFPLPVENVTGLIVLRGEELTIENAKCRHGDSWFAVNGRLSSIAADGAIDVTVDSDAVALTKDAHNALPQAVRQVWDHFAPEGSVGLHWVTKREAGPGNELICDVTVRPKGLKASFDGVPYSLDRIEGEVWTDAKRVEVRRLAGKHGEASLEIRGTVDNLAALPTYDLTLNGDEIPIDGDLSAALPQEFAAILADVHLKGILKIGDLHFRSAGEEVAYEAKSIRIHDGSLKAGLEFGALDGVELEAFGSFGSGSHKVRGQILGGSFRIADVKLTKLGGIFSFENGGLRIDEIQGTCYDGGVTGAVVYDTQSTAWNVGVKATNINLLQLTRDSRMNGKNITGRADGELRLKGTGGNSKGFTGDGAISLKHSELHEVPLLVSVFNVLKLKGTRDVFTKGSVTFDVGDGLFSVSDLLLASDSMDLESDAGEMDFEGNLRLKLSPNMHNLLLKPLNAFTAVYVTGTFAEPDSQVLPTIKIPNLRPKKK